MSNDTHTVMWFRSSRGVGVFNRPLRKLYVWYPDSRSLAGWETAAPLRGILEQLLEDASQVLIHAAAISRAGRVVLLAGPGGSGKSTLALEWVKQGYSYLGDDYCIAGRDRIYSLYGTAKQQTGPGFKLPWFRSLPAESLAPCGDKTIVFVNEVWPDRLVRSGALSAVVTLRLCGHEQPALKRIGAGQALSRMAPSTLAQSEGCEQKALSRMKRLIEKVPAFELSVPLRIDRVPVYIADKLLPV